MDWSGSRFLATVITLVSGVCSPALVSAATIEITASESTVVSNQPVVFDVLASNNTGSTQSDLTVEMVVPAAVDDFNELIVLGPLDADASCDDFGASVSVCDPGDTVIWDIGDLAPGEVRHLSFQTEVFSTTSLTVDLLEDGSQEASATADVTVVSSSPLSLNIVEAQDPVARGAVQTFRVSWASLTTSALSNAAVALTLPAGTSFLSADNGGVEAGGVVSWNLGTLVANEVGILEVRAAVGAGVAAGTLLETSARFDADVSPTESVFEEVSSLAHVRDGAPLQMAMTLNTELSGGTSSFLDIAVSNPGATTQSGVTMRMRLPRGNPSFSEQLVTGALDLTESCRFTGASASTCEDSDILVWNFGDVAPGETVLTTMLVSAFFNTSQGWQRRYTAQLFTDDYTIEEAVVGITKADTLNLIVSEDQDPVAPGGELVYRVDWGNPTAANLDQTTLTLTLPDAVTFLSASDGGVHTNGVVSWTLNTIGAGRTDRFTVRTRAGASLDDGTLLEAEAEIAANVTFLQREFERASTVATVQAEAPLQLAAVFDANPRQSGGVNVLQLEIANPGSSTRSNVTMEMRWPAGIQDMPKPAATGLINNAESCTLLGFGECSFGDVLRWSLGDVEPGQTLISTLPIETRVQLPEGFMTQFKLRAFVGEDIVETSTVLVDAGDEYALSLLEEQDPAMPGGPLNYTLDWAVEGDASLDGTTLTFKLPEEVEFVSATGGGVHGNGTVVWTLNTLNPLEIGRFEVRTRVDESVSDGTLLRGEAEMTGSSGIFSVVAERAESVTRVQTAPPMGLAVTIHNRDEISPFATIPGRRLLEIVVSNPGSQPREAVLEMRWPHFSGDLDESDVLGPLDAANSCFGLDSNGSECEEGERLRWNFGTMAPGQVFVTQVPFEFVTLLFDSLARLEFRAHLRSAGEIVEQTKAATLEFPFTAGQGSLDVELDLVDAADSNGNRDGLKPGDSVTFGITYGNYSEADIDDVTLTMPVPAGLVFEYATGGGTLSDGRVVWNAGTVPAQEIARQAVRLRVPDTAPSGTLIDARVDITGNGARAENAQRAAVVQSVSPLRLDLSFPSVPVVLPDPTQLKLAVTNAGEQPLFGVEIEMHYPPGLLTAFEDNGSVGTVSGINCSFGTCFLTSLQLAWIVGNIAPGETLEFEIAPVSGLALGVPVNMMAFATDSSGAVALSSTTTANATEGSDADSDGIDDALDNCVGVANFNQHDNELDGAGDVCDVDDDNDGMTDLFELQFGLNPLLAADALEDPDGDGLNNREEARNRTNPNLADTDGDGATDSFEVAGGFDPLDPSDCVEGVCEAVSSGSATLKILLLEGAQE